jgi:Ca-activated chloride channel homolog
MKRLLATCIIVFLGHTLFSLVGQGRRDDVLKIETNLVNVFFSAVDKDKKFFNSLEHSDVKVYEDGVEQQIQTFQQSTDRPLLIALLIDVSGSEQNRLPEEKAAAKSFADTLIRGRDHLAVISFAADSFLEQPLADKIGEAQTAIDRISVITGRRGYQGMGTILPAGTKAASGSLSYTSAIWDALWITCHNVMAEAPGNSRKVIVIVTDGQDTSSRASIDESINEALKRGVVIYLIGVGDSTIGDGVNKRALGQIARRTGGKMFAPKKDDDLRSAFQSTAEELRSQYLATYVTHSKSAESYRQIRVELANPDRSRGLRFFYQPGYYVPKSQALK